MYYVYLLKSLKDNNYYIGQTKDVPKRLTRHNSGQVISTKARRPLKLIGYRAFDSRSEARWVEHELKNHSDKKKKFIEKLIAAGFNGGLRLGEPLARRASGSERG
ncbi:MAG: endonuclease [Candidatus Levybacteria bacterium CG_4_10_14_0_8_um_filter_35_23]|nr:MAG: endonuclease [Candidatus Levybacteria bacterium CG_4_10_14_0_8_um_filter_35_23]